MTDYIDFAGECMNCYRSVKVAWQVKHPETCMHWRCSSCFRELLSGNRPVLIVGFAKPTIKSGSTEVLRVHKACKAANEAWAFHE